MSETLREKLFEHFAYEFYLMLPKDVRQPERGILNKHIDDIISIVRTACEEAKPKLNKTDSSDAAEIFHNGFEIGVSDYHDALLEKMK